jgi:hypothetical protein
MASMADVPPPARGSKGDPFGFFAAINWDVVDEHADEIAALFEKGQDR